MEVVKVCKVHGDLTKEQVRFRKPPRTEIVCKQCESIRNKNRDPKKVKAHRDKYRYIDRPADTKEMKCSKCSLTKPINLFNKYMLRIRSPYCAECRQNATREHHNKPESKIKHKLWYKRYEENAEDARMKRLYGISLNQYKLMFEEQNGCCALCHQPETSKAASGKILRLSVDHNHQTGSIRGLLCFVCNRGIGFIRDDIELAIRVLEYIDE